MRLGGVAYVVKKSTADRSFHGASRYRAVMGAASISFLYSCVRTPSLASLFQCTRAIMSRHSTTSTRRRCLGRSCGWWPPIGSPPCRGGCRGGNASPPKRSAPPPGGGVSGGAAGGPAAPAPTGEMFFECNGPLSKRPRLTIIRAASIRLSERVWCCKRLQGIHKSAQRWGSTSTTDTVGDLGWPGGGTEWNAEGAGEQRARVRACAGAPVVVALSHQEPHRSISSSQELIVQFEYTTTRMIRRRQRRCQTDRPPPDITPLPTTR